MNMLAKTKKKVWKYPVSVTVKKGDNVVFTILTQLYSAVGVYVCVYLRGRRMLNQFGMKPSSAANYFKKVWGQSNLKKGLTVEYGHEVKVTTDDEGFYIKVKEN